MNLQLNIIYIRKDVTQLFKRFVAIFVAAMMIVTIAPVTLLKKVQAYQNSAYFRDLKVGLVSMSALSMNLTLNGEYSLNGQVYPSGTILPLKVNGASISINGINYSEVNLIPKDTNSLLSITSGTATYKYIGSFVIKIYNGKLLPINYIDMENYLKGVVGYEMSDYFPIEALKAQAVAARNYALSRVGWEAAKGYDLDDTINYQVYKGFNPALKNVIRSVDETRGQVLLYNDKLVETLYSAWHGGYSENSENVWGNYVPYLRAIQDPYENDPWPNGNRTFTKAQIQSTLATKGYLTSTDTFMELDLNSITKYTSGRVSNINIIYKDIAGLTKTKSFTRDATRTFLSLPSNMYNVVYDQTTSVYTFSGKGNGHGLGMSQIGAKNRAAAGQTFEQILRFYYQNSYIQNLILKANLISATESKDKLFTGESISFNANASAGNGYGYLFKYVIKNAGDTVLTKDYSSTSSLEYVPQIPGTYTVEVYVKDKYSSQEYDDRRDLSFTVYSNPVLNSFSTDKVETLTGQGVTVNLDMKEGSGSFLYRYEVSKDGTNVLTREYLSDKQFVFTPNEAGSYTITAYIKDALSSKEYDFKQLQNITVYNSLTLTSFNKDKENIFIGNMINFNAEVIGGSGKGVYYKYVVIKDGNTLMTRDYEMNNLFSYMPNAAGNYEVLVYAKDAISDSQYDLVDKLDFAVRESAVITNFTTNKDKSFINDTVKLQATGNKEDSLYKFVVLKDGASVYTREYEANAALEYTPQASGEYEVQVYAKDSLSSAEYDDTKSLKIVVYDYAEISSFTQDREQLLKNDEVKLNANTVKGSGSYLYKFIVEKDNQAVSTQEFSTANTLSYIPGVEGNYTVNVYVKDTLSQKEYDDVKTLSFVVLPDAKLENVLVNKTNLLSGQTIKVNAAVISGSGSYLYKYVVTKDQESVITSEYSNSSSFEYAANTAGAYSISVYIKDALSSKEFDDTRVINITVFNEPSMTYTTTHNDTTIGNKVQYSINAANGSGTYEYKFIIMKDSQIISDNAYSSFNTFDFTPTDVGTYQVYGYMKDTLSEKAYDAVQVLTLDVTAKSAKVDNVTINTTNLLVGQNVIVNAVASADSLYKYVISKDNSVVFTKDYSKDTTVSYVPSEAGLYQVTVYVRNVLSANAYDDMRTVSATLYSKPQVSSATAAGTFYVSKGVSLTTNISGGSPSGVSYKYEVYKNGALVTANTYNASNTFTFTPGTSGLYNIKVYVKDSLSISTYDSIKEFNFTILSKPLYLSKLPLSYGMDNADVVSLQKALMKLGYSISSATGYFGTQTKSAVISFQRSRGLYADGIVGSMTYNALNEALIQKEGIKILSY